MREKKFRQPIFNEDGTFGEWHYFGLDGQMAGYVYKNNHAIECHEFTGLKDKNGKEIYEGDIVKRGNTYAIIEYCTKNAAFYVKHKTHNFFFGWDISECELEVSGNIHKNPELLNA